MICDIKAPELFNVVICKTFKLRLMLCTERIFISFKKHIHSGLKQTSKPFDFSRLFTGKTSANIRERAVDMQQAVMRKVQISRQLRTTSRTIRRLGEKFNANDVTNDSTRTKRPRVTTHGRDWRSVTSHLRDRLMPAVVTAGNTPVTHNSSATGPFSETGTCCGSKSKALRNLGTGGCCKWASNEFLFWHIPLLNNYITWSITTEWKKKKKKRKKKTFVWSKFT